VNRIWQGHFGSGLVRSPSNFGLRGEPPTHPQLLDWLAREFISTGWSVKHMHRTIMLSAAYQRSSQADPAQTVADPDNIYLARQNRRRLEAEPIRDALLFVSGRLDQSGDRSLGKLETNKEYYRAEKESFEKLTRAVYLPVVRANGYEMFATFDAADPAVHHQQRATTIVPSQALFMLNGELAFNAARDLAAGITENPAVETEARLNDLYLRLFGRPVRPQEAELLLGEFHADNEEGANPSIADWERICRVLIAANEFVYVN
jgi:class 3 adenylate cyclase